MFLYVIRTCFSTWVMTVRWKQVFYWLTQIVHQGMVICCNVWFVYEIGMIIPFSIQYRYVGCLWIPFFLFLENNFFYKMALHSLFKAKIPFFPFPPMIPFLCLLSYVFLVGVWVRLSGALHARDRAHMK